MPCQHACMHNMPCKLCLQYADMHAQYVNMQYACDAQYPCAMWMRNSPKIKAHGVAHKRISLLLHVFGKDFEVGMLCVHDSILCTHVGILQIHADIGHEITTSCKVHWKNQVRWTPFTKTSFFSYNLSCQDFPFTSATLTFDTLCPQLRAQASTSVRTNV